MEFSFPVPDATSNSAFPTPDDLSRGRESAAPKAAPPTPKASLPPPLTATSTVTHAVIPGKAPRPTPGVSAFVARPGKVPYEKGYSQMDWMAKQRGREDLSGTGGIFRKDITLAEVAQHHTIDDCWVVIRGVVYNLTSYLKFHPGGAGILVKCAGTDATALFNKYHAWVNADFMLKRNQVGRLLVEEG